MKTENMKKLYVEYMKRRKIVQENEMPSKEILKAVEKKK